MRVLLRNPRRELEVDGPITVHALLQRLDLNPESVLVIADDELVPRDARLADASSVEIRRHNAAFCPEHFVAHCREQTRRALSDHDMARPGERVLVAVSGGKDSL